MQIEGISPPDAAKSIPSQVVDVDSLEAGEVEDHSEVSVGGWGDQTYTLYMCTRQVLASLGQSLVRVFSEGQCV